MFIRRFLFCLLLSAVIFCANYLPVYAAKGSGSGTSENDLLYAIMLRDSKKAAELIENGADPNTCDTTGKTVLMYAAEKGNKEIVNLLVSKLAVHDKRDRFGKIALMYALNEYGIMDRNDPAAADYLEIIKTLLSRCNNVNNYTDSWDETLLMYAVRAKCPEAVKILISKGVQANCENLNGETALAITEENYNMMPDDSKGPGFKKALAEIIDMLTKAGAIHEYKWGDY